MPAGACPPRCGGGGGGRHRRGGGGPGCRVAPGEPRSPRHGGGGAVARDGSAGGALGRAAVTAAAVSVASGGCDGRGGVLDCGLDGGAPEGAAPGGRVLHGVAPDSGTTATGKCSAAAPTGKGAAVASTGNGAAVASTSNGTAVAAVAAVAAFAAAAAADAGTAHGAADAVAVAVGDAPPQVRHRVVGHARWRWVDARRRAPCRPLVRAVDLVWCSQ